MRIGAGDGGPCRAARALRFGVAGGCGPNGEDGGDAQCSKRATNEVLLASRRGRAPRDFSGYLFGLGPAGANAIEVGHVAACQDILDELRPNHSKEHAYVGMGGGVVIEGDSEFR